MSDSESILQAELKAAAEFDPRDSPISVSRGFAGWLLENQISLAFTSYQTGQLVLLGAGPDERLSINEQNYARATGLCYSNGRLHVGSMFQIWRLENMLRPGQFANGAYDCVLVPRSAQTVNYVDIHEIGVDAADQVVFVNSRYSCLAAFDERFSFRPIWKPPFITALAPEDRCHLNGLAMAAGMPRYVTALAVSDVKDGWREQRRQGGVLIDVESGQIVVEHLSMPHSPRIHDGALWMLESGRGQIVRVDETGRAADIAFCPGFLRGLVFHDGYAIVTVSKAREDNFRELPLQTGLERRRMNASCGILIVDLARGAIVESVLYDGKISELFDVAVLPGIRNPMSVGPATVEMIGSVSVADSSTLSSHSSRA